ncbi:hypothetical protein EBZ39_11350, partial [bacterium]|nr:hypothetical protein [bacterium]
MLRHCAIPLVLAKLTKFGNALFSKKLEHWNKLRNYLIYKVKTCSNQRSNLEQLLEHGYKVGTRSYQAQQSLYEKCKSDF